MTALATAVLEPCSLQFADEFSDLGRHLAMVPQWYRRCTARLVVASKSPACGSQAARSVEHPIACNPRRSRPVV